MHSDDSNTSSRLDRESLRALGQTLERHFPQPAEQTELVLMPISPHRLYAYWHITPQDLQAAKLRAGSGLSRLVIRFHDLGETALEPSHPAWFDLEIDNLSGNRYIELWKDAKSYQAELALYTAQGTLLDLATSNRVELPRSGESPVRGRRSMTLTPEANRLFEASPRRRTRSAEQCWQENPDQPLDLTLLSHGLSLYPVFPDPSRPDGGIARLALPCFPSIDALTLGLDAVSTRAMDRVTGSPAPEAAASSEIRRELPRCRVEALTGFTPGDAVSLHRPYWPEPAAKTWPASPLPPWPDELPVHIPGSATAHTGVAPAPSSYPQPVSSFEPEPTEQTELHMELHIRGRTRTNGPYMLHGQPIATAADGSFSLRLELPGETAQLVAQLLAASRGE